MEDLVRTELGKRIISLREQRQWDQEDLAREARVGRSWLSLVETGDIKMPGSAKLSRVAAALGVTPEYLLYGDRGESEVALRIPSERIGRVGQFLQAHPTIQDALVDMIGPLERRFGLPIERVPEEDDGLPEQMSEDGTGEETQDEPEH